jgi:plastocyanin
LKTVRRLSYVGTVLIIALVLVMPNAGAQQGQSAGGTPAANVWSVSIQDYFFDPADAGIEPGDSIVFTNEGAVAHTVTADDAQFDSGSLNPGESYEVTFQGEGTVSYHCQIHPEMVGSVTVGSTSEPTQPAGETIYIPGGTLTHYEGVG